MLAWLSCLLAPKSVDLLAAPAPPLPDPADADGLSERTAAAFAAVRDVTFTPRCERSAYRHLWAMGCQDLVTREADQDPDTAGRTPNFERLGTGFEPIEIRIDDDFRLTGHHAAVAPGAPVVFVVHGLFDSHVSHYVVAWAEALRRWGFHVVALDMRDHGRLRGRPPAMSLGLFEGRDLLTAARSFAEKEGVSVGILGLSYGGHCAVRAAYEASKGGCADVLRGGVLAMCAPLNVHEAVLALDDPEARLPRPHGLLDRIVLKGLIHTFERHRELRARELGRLEYRIASHGEYVRSAILPRYPDEPGLLGSFLGKARSAQPDVMGAIEVPTLLVHAGDDPLVPAFHTAEAMAAARKNPWVDALVLPCGGHIAFHQEDPEATLAIVGRFFGSLRG